MATLRPLACLTALMLVLVIAPAHAQLPFARHNANLGQMSGAILIHDFNGDRYPDAVISVAFFGPSVWFGAGDGSFDFVAPIPGGVGLASLGLADLDGDGLGDVFGGQTTTGDLVVMLGTGGGAFGPPTNYEALGGPNAVASGDVDGDGDLDVAVAGTGANRVRVFLNNGDGTLVQGTTYPVQDYPRSVQMADLDGDTDVDMVVANRHADTLSVFINPGNGAFPPGVIYPADQSPHNLVLVDATGDGLLDALVGTGDISDDRVTILPGNGDGTFASFDTVNVGGDYPLRPLVADMDEDGIVDLVAPTALEDGIAVLPGLGGGAFGTPVFYPTSNNPQFLEVVDLDDDGNLDVLVANFNSDILTVLRGFGDGTLGDNHPVGDQPFGMAVDDFDADGELDILATSSSAPDVHVILGHGDGRFAPSIPSGAGGNQSWVATGDLDGDTLVDALVTRGTNTLIFLEGQGDGTFAAPVTEGITPGMTELALADLDGGGVLDLVVRGDGGLYALTGDGDGTFSNPVNFPDVGFGAGAIVGEFTGDSAPDLLDVLGSGDVRVVPGTGDGAFGTPILTSIAEAQPEAISVGDFDADGEADVVVLGPFQGMTIVFGNGDGSFSNEVNIATLDGAPGDVIAGDFDNDGDIDIVNGGTSSFTNGLVGVHLNNGDGTFAAPLSLTLGAEAQQVIAADFNRDGVDDIAWTVGSEFGQPSTDASHVTVLLSTEGPWDNLGHPLAGSDGVPTTVGVGPLQPGTEFELVLDDGLENGVGILVVSSTALNAPLAGGFLVPSPVLLISLPLDADGHTELSATWPAGIPSGFEIYYQWWMQDAGGIFGRSSSNALQTTAP